MTRRRRLLIGLGILALVGVALWLVLRERKSAQQQILETIIALADAVESQDVAGCMRLISPDYRDSKGNTRIVLRRLASDGFREAQSIDITLQEPEITVSGRDATAVLEVNVTAVTATGRHEWDLEVTLTFKGERRSWRIVRAEGWQHLSGQW
jgi:ketosteroid isomerase-like protein